MSTIETVEENLNVEIEQTPGVQLAKAREEKGYSIEYVAGKLHLRAQVVELLEADDYQNMPEPVFIKGYLRAYAKLLEQDPEPYISRFNNLYVPEPVADRTLWQSRKETNISLHAMRFVTIAFGVGVIIAVGIWWHNSNENSFKKAALPSTALTSKTEKEIRLTDLSNMRSLLSSSQKFSSVELPGD